MTYGVDELGATDELDTTFEVLGVGALLLGAGADVVVGTYTLELGVTTLLEDDEIYTLLEEGVEIEVVTIGVEVLDTAKVVVNLFA